MSFNYPQHPPIDPSKFNWRETFRPSNLTVDTEMNRYVFQYIIGSYGGAPLPSHFKFFMPPGILVGTAVTIVYLDGRPTRAVWKLGSPPTTSASDVSKELASTPENAGGIYGTDWNKAWKNTVERREQYFWGEPNAGVMSMDYGSVFDTPTTIAGYVYANVDLPSTGTVMTLTFYLDRAVYDAWYARSDIWDGNYPKEIIHYTGAPATDTGGGTNNGGGSPGIGGTTPPTSIGTPPALTGLMLSKTSIQVGADGETGMFFLYPLPPGAILPPCQAIDDLSTNTISPLVEYAEADLAPRTRQLWSVNVAKASTLTTSKLVTIVGGGHQASIEVKPLGYATSVSATEVVDPDTNLVTLDVTLQLGTTEIGLGGTFAYWIAGLIVEEDFFAPVVWRFLAGVPGGHEWKLLGDSRTEVAYATSPVESTPIQLSIPLHFTRVAATDAKVEIYFGYQTSASSRFVNMGSIWTAY